MKKFFKETWPVLVTIITFCFMLFLFEPMLMLMNNQNDFWFDMGILFEHSFILFLIAFIILFVVFLIAYKFNKKIFNILTIAFFVVFVCTYIQGNYLVGNLPLLDGEKVVYGGHLVDNLITLGIWAIFIGLAIFLYKKLKVEELIKYTGYISGVVFVMLFVSLLTVFINFSPSIYKIMTSASTYNNLNIYSTDKNYIILVLDACDSRLFNKTLTEDPEYKDLLKDFTYYPDTMSMHPYTLESIPYILTNEVYQNQSRLDQYTTKAYKNSYLFKMMWDKDYDVNVYEKELFFYDNDALKISNVVDYNARTINVRSIKFMKQELKYVMFRYLPYFLKKYSNIETMTWKRPELIENAPDYYTDDNFWFVDYLNEHKLETKEKKQFKFVHIDGAHVPFNMNKKLQKLPDMTYKDELEGTVVITDMYFDYLKESNVYDNSVIVVMADHGYNFKEVSGRQNPILYIKGINEKHDKMQESSKPISFADLKDAFTLLLEDKSSNELFQDIPNERTRRYLWYIYEEGNHMVEYETKDKAWETDKMYKTGKTYDR